MDFNKEHSIETYRSLIKVSLEGLKTLLLINGGAVIAVLAYLGQTKQGPKLASYAWFPVGIFVSGVFLCAFAFLGSYCTQFALYNESVNSGEYNGPPHVICLWVTIVLIVLSLLCFAGGSFSMLCVLSKQSTI